MKKKMRCKPCVPAIIKGNVRSLGNKMDKLGVLTKTQCYSQKEGRRDCTVNERWCNPGHVTVKERFCSPDIELLAVGLRPFDLPRELHSVIVVAVYIPPYAERGGGW